MIVFHSPHESQRPDHLLCEVWQAVQENVGALVIRLACPYAPITIEDSAPVRRVVSN